MSREVLVVTGAGGIGQALARRQGPGKSVLLADFNEETLQSAANALDGAGLDGGVAEDELEVLGQQEEHAEQRQEREGDGAAGSREAWVSEEPHVQHRVPGVQLPLGEPDQHHGTAGETPRGRTRALPDVRNCREAAGEGHPVVLRFTCDNAGG